MILHPARQTFLTKHHLTPKSRGGHLSPQNTLKLWRDSHTLWHKLFGRRTLQEIICFLSNHKSYELKRKYKSMDWIRLFGLKTIKQVICLMKRIKSIKACLRKQKSP